MKQIIITRKKKLASVLMPFWIITGQTKMEFMARHGLTHDRVKSDMMGQPIRQLDDISVLDAVGTRIANGQTVTVETDTRTVFAATMDGALSNEIALGCGDGTAIRLTLLAKGGWLAPSYPWLEISEAKQGDIT